MLDVWLHYDRLSRSWTIELRKLGGRIVVRQTHADCPLSAVEPHARLLADFLGATLTRDVPEEFRPARRSDP